MNRRLLCLAVFLVLISSIQASGKLYLAILWHQHQPNYYNPAQQQLIMPWVRLHATKDYYDMVKVLEQFPRIELTVNLVPVLLSQIEMYVNEGKVDYIMSLHKKKVSALTDKEKIYLIERCFDISWENVIRKFPEYSRLLAKREGLKKTVPTSELPKKFTDKEILDMQVWFNLAWLDPYFHDSHPLVRSLIEKGKKFAHKDMQDLLALQLRIMEKIIPLHRKLFARGQIELVTTPFYHPILPLLCDASDTLKAMPAADLPSYEKLENCARDQVNLAVEYFKKHFIASPKGMWPAEGSVSMKALNLFSEAGLLWVATDEKVLAKSLGKSAQRASGHLLNPEVFCNPYKFKLENGKEIAVVFRDTYLSDKLGFDYSGIPAKEACDHFLAYMKNIYNRTRDSGKDHLVTIILDGENAWENYPNDGHDFFELFYETLEKTEWIKTTRLSRYVRSHFSTLPEAEEIWPGSWINSDYSTWIGESEENIAWDHTFSAYRFLTAHKERGEKYEKAYDALLAALGSDWYWWYGKDQESGNDEAFDLLFREHVANIYRNLDLPRPKELSATVLKPKSVQGKRPEKKATPVIDGKAETIWKTAGSWDLTEGGGVMQRESRLSRFSYCFDDKNLYMALSVQNPLEKIILYGRSGRNNLTNSDQDMDLNANVNYKLDIVTKGPWAKLYRSGKDGMWGDALPLKVSGKNFLELSIPLSSFKANEFSVLPVLKIRDKNPELFRKDFFMTLSWPAPETTIASFKDLLGDDHGAGGITYPLNIAFTEGCYDISSFRITESGDNYCFYTGIETLENPWHSQRGFCVQTIDIYLCKDKGLKELLPGRGAQIREGGWQHCAVVEAWESKLFSESNGKREETCVLDPGISFSGKEIKVCLPKDKIGNIYDYSLVVAVLGQDGYADETTLRVRRIGEKIDEWAFSGKEHKAESAIIDLLDPVKDQDKQLTPTRGKVLLTPIKIKQ